MRLVPWGLPELQSEHCVPTPTIVDPRTPQNKWGSTCRLVTDLNLNIATCNALLRRCEGDPGELISLLPQTNLTGSATYELAPPSIQEGLNDPLDLATMFQHWGHMEGNRVELIYQKQELLRGNQVGLLFVNKKCYRVTVRENLACVLEALIEYISQPSRYLHRLMPIPCTRTWISTITLMNTQGAREKSKGRALN